MTNNCSPDKNHLLYVTITNTVFCDGTGMVVFLSNGFSNLSHNVNIVYY